MSVDQRSDAGQQGPSPADMARVWAELAKRGERVMQEMMKAQPEVGDGFSIPDPSVVSKAFLAWSAKAAENPRPLMEAQQALWRDYARLWEATSKRLQGEPAEPVAIPDKGDRRFADDMWSENPMFDFIKQSYLLAARSTLAAVRKVEGLDEQTARKVDFYTRQAIDAMAPTNFVATNPKVMRETLESGGENLIKGLDNLIKDLQRGHGWLDIAMTDYGAFELGRNVAVTPGKVVFQNEMMQLIQYAPATDKVHRRPLLLVPPWINKFYILDLKPKNSLIKWVVEQGHTMFVVSWINPGPDMAHKTFEDYMIDGPLAALDAIEQATGEREANIIGYCIGGTLTAATLAWMAAKGDDRVKSATFFTTMIDFAEAGELSVFIDEEQLENLRRHLMAKGYLEGKWMKTVFNLLRSNDLIWSFVVNNYLLGKEPFPFDLLFWNSDSTRMPAMMHDFYLRNMYLENRLVQQGGITLAGVPIDLKKVGMPVYVISTREDHIAPWKSTYRATQLYSGPVKFVLSASGHIAGVVNPPAANKYCYWTNTRTPADPEKWLESAKQTDGSWWPDWAKWVARHGGGKVKARVPGDGKLPAIDDAPGSYVKVQAKD